jgi:hypothetical protein
LHVQKVCQLLVLLGLANGIPVLVNRLFGRRGNWPLDRRWVLPDGQPLFGSSKTIRGIVTAIAATIVGAMAFGLGWKLGAITGAAAMSGDLFSSFCKRRLRLASGSRATGLDQIPESLLPSLAVRHMLGLSAIDVMATVAIFMVAEMVLSVLFFRYHLRERPY